VADLLSAHARSLDNGYSSHQRHQQTMRTAIPQPAQFAAEDQHLNSPSSRKNRCQTMRFVFQADPDYQQELSLVLIPTAAFPEI